MKKLLSVLLALAMVVSLIPAMTLAGAYTNPTSHAWTISTARDLINFGLHLNMNHTDYSESYVMLTSDIDMSSVTDTWKTGKFSGIFDGNGYTIRNFNSVNGGLVTYLDRGAIIQNLKFEGAAITNTGTMNVHCVGAVANQCAGVVKDCTVTDSNLHADCNAIGGIVGILGGPVVGVVEDLNPVDAPYQSTCDIYSDDDPASGGVLNCVVGTGTVVRGENRYITQGTYQVGTVGGVVGKTDGGTIENCANFATVFGLRPGGIVGETQAGSFIRHCENYGFVTMPEEAGTAYPITEPSPDNPIVFTIQSAWQAYVDSFTNYTVYTMGDVARQYELGAGGILGVAIGGQIIVENCMNYGSVCSLFNCGGIAGLMIDAKTMIVNCGNDYKRGDENYDSSLRGIYYVGGLVGYLEAAQTDPYFDHPNVYAAQFESTAALIYNSYNAMNLCTDGFFKGEDYTDGTFGGLIGYATGTGSMPSIENCHNAALPSEKEISNVSFGRVGSLVGLLYDTSMHIMHCFGIVNYYGVWNVIDNQVSLMQPGYVNMELIGEDLTPHHFSGGYYLDNSGYTLYQSVFDGLGINESACCGGVLVDVVPGTAPAIYDVQISSGVLSNSKYVLDELNAYQQTYLYTKADQNGRPCKLTAAFLPWFCADPTHLNGGVLLCEEYAVFHSSGLMQPYFVLEIPVPTITFHQVEDPYTAHTDPNVDPIEVLQPGRSIRHSLTLDGDIGLNFYVSIPAASEEAYAEFDFGTTHVEVPIDLSKCITDEDGNQLYKFRCAVNSSQISMQITGTVHNHAVVESEEIDLWVESDTFSYSVNDYLDAVSNSTAYQNQTNLMNLMRAVSVYGFYANELFGTDPAFVQSALFDDSMLQTVNAASLAHYAAAIESFDDAVNYIGSSLVLRTTTAIHHYFTVSDGINVSDLIFVYDGEDGEIELTPKFNGESYFVEIPNIASANLGKTYSVRVLYPSNTGEKLLFAKWCYSGMSYAYKAISLSETGGVSDELLHTAQALAVYFNCAKAYFNKTSQA